MISNLYTIPAYNSSAYILYKERANFLYITYLDFYFFKFNFYGLSFLYCFNLDIDLLDCKKFISFLKSHKISLLIFNSINNLPHSSSSPSSIQFGYKSTSYFDLSLSEADLFKLYKKNYRHEIRKVSSMKYVLHTNNYSLIPMAYDIHKLVLSNEGQPVLDFSDFSSFCHSNDSNFLVLVDNRSTNILCFILTLNNNHTSSYFLGGSNPNFASPPGALKYLLHNAVLLAKDSGFNFFDFGGLNCSSDTRKTNIDNFKLRFGGRILNFVSYKFVLNFRGHFVYFLIFLRQFFTTNG